MSQSAASSPYRYIRLLPTVVEHCMIVGYADDHTLLKIIPDKSDRFTATSQMNEDLRALSQFGKTWCIRFAPAKTSSLLISLKHDLLHPPLFMMILLFLRLVQSKF